ncbi:MAG: hypothetical protein DMF58_19360 [Acidobacteria bacterium]|nr:MAG: hypothetical protein DMF17_12815 [Verrucomicrobiota bacterium]PYQ56992.1 MAG: hypothetical protein DMF58_19360 [Acidobacteriota bacterium]
MQALEFWKAVTVDRTDFLERIIALLEKNRIRFCVVGGQAVNAYAEPVVSIDLDIAVVVEDFARAENLLRETFEIRDFPHSLNVAAPGSDLRVQLQKDPRYASFPDRAQNRNVLGLTLPVAAIEDVLRGKIWAAQDPGGRGSKRQKDLADIARLLESHPHLRPLIPREILDRLF